MRHRKKTNHLSRQHAHRKAMLANMASSLILHKRITTTTAKAKELRTFVEPLITRSKEDSTHSRRMVFKHIRDKYAVSELFRDVATKVGDRPGGYTRIIKLGNRLGDNADMCIIELVDYNENLLAEKAAVTKPKSSRRRRGSKKKATDEKAGAVVAPEAEDTGTTEEKTSEPTVEAAAEEEEAPTEPENPPAAEAETKAASGTGEEGSVPAGDEEAEKDTDKEEKKEE
jgi:large subunit ribosomal protein L17